MEEIKMDNYKPTKLSLEEFLKLSPEERKHLREFHKAKIAPAKLGDKDFGYVSINESKYKV